MKKYQRTRRLLSTAAVASFAFAGALHAQLYWDVNGVTNGSGNLGGNWNATDTNWTSDIDGDAATAAWVDGNAAIFSTGVDGTGAWTVTVSGTVDPTTITFKDLGSKIVNGGTIDIGGGTISSNAFPLSGADDIVIGSVLSGAGGLTLISHGDATSDTGGGSASEMRLNGVNTFTGGLTITRGLVSFAGDSSLGDAAGGITLNGGGLLANTGAAVSVNRNITIGASGGTFRAYGGANVLNLSGTITGSGLVRKTDSGALTVNSDVSGYTGQWNNRGGDTTFSTTNLTGLTLDSRSAGRVFFTNAGTTTIKTVTTGRDLFVNNSGRLNIVNGASGVLNFVTGAGFWVQRTSGTGSLTSSSGSLVVNTGGAASGTLETSVQDIRINIVDFDGVTPLAVTKNNVNQLTLTQANTFSGGLTINAGRVQGDNLAAFGTGTVTVNSGGQAYPLQAGTYTNNFVINGNGTPEGAGTLGAIRLNNGNILSGSVTVNTASRITAHNSTTTGTITGALLGSADLEINSSAGSNNGTVNLNGNVAGYSGTLTLTQGTLNVPGALTLANVAVVGGTGNYGAAIGGTFTQSGGTANLSGVVTGAASVSGGTLNLNSGAGVTTPTLTNGTLNVRTGSTVTGNVAPAASALLNVAGGTITGDVLITTTGTIGINGGSVSGDLTLGDDAFSTTNLNFTAPSTVNNLIGRGTTTVNLLTAPSPGSPVTILSYSGTATDPDDADIENNFALGNPAAYRSAIFSDAGGSITLDTGSATHKWVGGDGTNPTFWDVGITLNWTSADQKFFNGDALTFDDTATSFTVAAQSAVAPSSVTFNNTTNAYTFTGSGTNGIVGTTGITKNGTGLLSLGGEGNLFTGPVNVNAGQITLTTTRAFGATSGITVAAGATVNLNGLAIGESATLGGHSWTIAGDGGDGPGGVGAINNTGAATFGNSGVKDLTLSANAEIGGVGRYDVGRHAGAGTSGTINGNGFTLTKIGANQMVFRGPASNITFVINEGTINFEDFDTASGTNLITVNNTATVGTFGARTIPNDVLLSAVGTNLSNLGGGNGTWTGTISAPLGANINTGAGTIILDGAIAGAGTLTRSGGNILVLQNSSAAFSGKINNTAGTLRVEGPGALGTATGADVIRLGSGTTLQGGTIAALASTTVGTATTGITHATSGSTVFYDSGAGNTLTVPGPVAGGVTALATQNGTVAFSNTLTLSDPANTVGNIVVQNNSKVSFLSGANANVRQINLGLNGQGTSSNMDIATGATVTAQRLATGDGGSVTSVINHSGGIFNITGTNNSNSTSASILLGHWGGGTTAYNLSGGELNAPATLMSLGWDTVGTTFNVSGGTANLLGINLNNGRNNTGAVNLTGGRINLGGNGINNASNKAVNLGGGTMGAFANWSSTKPVTLTGTGGATTFNTLDSVDGTTARTITLDAVVSGSGGLVKTGAGNLVLANTANTFTGTAEVNGGSLFVRSATTATSLKTSGTGSLQPGLLGSTAEVTVPKVDLSGGSATFRVGTATDKFIAPVLEVNAPTSITVIPTQAITGTPTYTLIDYDGAVGGSLGFAGLSLSLSNPHYSATLVDDPFTTEIQVNFTAADSVIWSGAINGAWDVNATENWVLGSDGTTPSKYYDFDVVSFTDLGLTNNVLTLTGSIKPATVSVNSSGNYTFQGTPLTGTMALTKNGTGALTLLADNNYTGTVAILGGTVNVGNGGTTGALGGTGAINFEGTLAYNRSDSVVINRTFTGSGVGTIVQNGSGNLRTGVAGIPAGVTVNSGTYQAIEGGWATSYFSSANRPVTINGGVFATSVHGLGGLGGVFNRPDMTINTGGTWRLDGEQYMQAGDIVLNGGSIVAATSDLRLEGGTMQVLATAGGSTITRTGSGFATLHATPTFNVADGAAAADLTVSVPVGQSGTQGFTKAGPGTMVLSQTNTFAGVVTISGGTLQVGSGSVLGDLGTSASVVNNGTLAVNRLDAFPLTAVVSGTGGLVNAGAGTTTLSAINTYTGNTTVNAGGITLADNAQLRFVLGANGVNNTVTGTGNAVFAGDFNIDLTGAAIANGNSWTLVNAATLTEAFDSTFTVIGFTESTPGVHTFVDGDNTWTFSESTGVLSLAVVSSAYDTWASAKGLTTGVNDGKAQDPDNDGKTNLLEFALDGDPLSAVNDGKVRHAVADVGGDDVFTLTLPVRTGATFAGATSKSASLDGITYTVEGSDQVGPWNLVISEVTPTLSAGLPALTSGWTYRTFRTPDDVSADPADFMRVKVEEDTP